MERKLNKPIYVWKPTYFYQVLLSSNTYSD
ncbi:Uncharacterised protein [Streptococcus pneumoniae]|nr:Uncharacterised protein [Streptococcus pneumoniae]CJJ97450.1 Uncharacterised protein [Streptococcus pneumoniae]CJK20525.1 Uncharacterised protein [Streptococcus pneumoniae]CJN99862.1 Uncharacterised protein [Streptococcus pneumoniae]CJO67912.1 Uncharacterised protein [Streptococcus pneumoniae]